VRNSTASKNRAVTFDTFSAPLSIYQGRGIEKHYYNAIASATKDSDLPEKQKIGLDWFCLKNV